LIEAIRKGASYTIACEYAGITDRCFYYWIDKAEKDEIQEFVDFFREFRIAKGEAAVSWLDVMDSAMVKEWTPAAWKLERRYYRDYSTNPVLLQDFKVMQEKIEMLEKQLLNDKDGSNVDNQTEKDHTEETQAPGSTCT
jgi:hypothetical protein